MIGQIKKVGSDIMFHAITHANVHDVIALLNDNEVDVNCTNINGQTPLHVSSSSMLAPRPLSQLKPTVALSEKRCTLLLPAHSSYPLLI